MKKIVYLLIMLSVFVSCSQDAAEYQEFSRKADAYSGEVTIRSSFSRPMVISKIIDGEDHSVAYMISFLAEGYSSDYSDTQDVSVKFTDGTVHNWSLITICDYLSGGKYQYLSGLYFNAEDVNNYLQLFSEKTIERFRIRYAEVINPRDAEECYRKLEIQ